MGTSSVDVGRTGTEREMVGEPPNRFENYHCPGVVSSGITYPNPEELGAEKLTSFGLQFPQEMKRISSKHLDRILNCLGVK